MRIKLRRYDSTVVSLPSSTPTPPSPKWQKTRHFEEGGAENGAMQLVFAQKMQQKASPSPFSHEFGENGEGE
jgi:hypothetical protein